MPNVSTYMCLSEQKTDNGYVLQKDNFTQILWSRSFDTQKASAPKEDRQ